MIEHRGQVSVMGGIAKIRSALVVAVLLLGMAGFTVGTNPGWVAPQLASRHQVRPDGAIRSAVKELTQNKDPGIHEAVDACARAWVGLKVSIPGAGELLAALQKNDEALVRSLIIDLQVSASPQAKKLVKLFFSVPQCAALTAKLWWQPRQLVDGEIPTTCGDGYRRVFDRDGRPMAICAEAADPRPDCEYRGDCAQDDPATGPPEQKSEDEPGAGGAAPDSPCPKGRIRTPGAGCRERVRAEPVHEPAPVEEPEPVDEPEPVEEPEPVDQPPGQDQPPCPDGSLDDANECQQPDPAPAAGQGEREHGRGERGRE